MKSKLPTFQYSARARNIQTGVILPWSVYCNTIQDGAPEHSFVTHIYHPGGTLADLAHSHKCETCSGSVLRLVAGTFQELPEDFFDDFKKES